MEFNERLFQALKKDNVKEFKSCMEISNCGPLRLGRFPVLSVMYLYNARRLIYAYEKKFLKHNSWQDIGEPVELSVKFRDVAGKCLRFYLNETVSPVEMLLLLNRDFKLKRVFSKAHITAPVKQRLKDVYFVKWGLQAQFVRNQIVLERRPMTRAEKLRWLTSTLCVVLCVALVVGTPFAVNTFAPFIPDGDGVLNVSRWEQIRFNSDKIYALKNDVTVPANFFVEEMNCQLYGNGHTVTVNAGSVFGNIKGTLQDIVFETNGSPVAEKVAFGATVDQVTVNAAVDMQTNKAVGFFANSNYGTVKNVAVNLSGNLSVTATEQDSFNCGGVVASNHTTEVGDDAYYAYLFNCAVNFDGFTLQGNLQADAAFGGIVGTNDAWVESCQTDGAIVADTFDVAGICAENNYVIVKSANGADITQSTAVAGWNPLAAGIAINNYYVVDHCENNGAIASISTAVATIGSDTPCAYAAGIAYQNVVTHGAVSYLQFSVNNGAVTATANNINASAAGVCNGTNGAIHTCENNGDINASGTQLVEAAGIVTVAYGYVYRSVNTGEIVANSEQTVRVGGIVGISCVDMVECLSVGSIDVTGKTCYVGGIMGYAMCDTDGVHTHCGMVEKCVSDCEITVTVNSSADGFAAVGGIVGYVQELLVSEQYKGGEIKSSYFTGKLQANAGAYVGGIVGVVGENIYIASAKNAQGNIHSNMYSDGCGVNLAFGAALDSNGSYKSVADVGALITPTSDIANDATYKAILQIFDGIKKSHI